MRFKVYGLGLTGLGGFGVEFRVWVVSGYPSGLDRKLETQLFAATVGAWDERL